MGANGGVATAGVVLLCIVAIAATGPAFLPSEESRTASTGPVDSDEGDGRRVLDVTGEQNIDVRGGLPDVNPLNGGSVFGLLAAAVIYVLVILAGAGRRLVDVAAADGSPSAAGAGGAGGGSGLPPEALAAVALVVAVALALARRRGLTLFAASPVALLGRWGERLRSAGIAAVLALAESIPALVGWLDRRHDGATAVGTDTEEPRPYGSLPRADENEVYRAWYQFAGSLPETSPDRPPRELVAAAARHGLPDGAVADLAAQYRAVRYGNREADETRIERARTAVAAIEDAFLESLEGEE